MAGELVEWGVDDLNVSGGEPLLRRDLMRLMKVFYDMDMDLSLNTNGILLNRGRAMELSKLECFVFLSIDGASRETHERLRGPGTWSRVLKAAKTLRSEGVPFAVVFAMNSRNFHEAGDIPRLAEKVGALYVATIPIIPSGAAHLPNGLALSPAKVFKGLKMFEESVEELGYFGSVWCAPFAKAFLKSRHVHVSGCSEGMDISPSGDILLCDTLDFTVSNVVRDGVRGAWRKLVGSSLYREAFLIRMPEECRGCPMFSRCRGGCVARAYLTHGTFQAADPLCPLLSRNGATAEA